MNFRRARAIGAFVDVEVNVELPSVDKPSIEKWKISADLFPLLGGHRNTVYRSTGLDQDVVFKSTRRTQASVAWLLEVHDLARQAGFVVPYLLKSRRGRLIEDGWTCEIFLDGYHIDADSMSDIRSQLSQFHEAASALEQRSGFQSSVALRSLASGGDVDLDKMPRQLVRRCRDAWNAVAERRQGIIHGDLNAGNILRTSDGRFALVDWDESRRDLLLFDIGQIEPDDKAGREARLAWEIAWSWVVEPEHARVLAARL